MIRKLIIFDFDGVLADSFEIFYPLIRDGMEKVGFKISKNQYRNFFTDNVHKNFENFINNKKKYLIFSKFRKDNYDKYYYNKLKIKLFPKTKEFIKGISKEYILTIASSGEKDNIKKLLSKNRIDNYFSLILADSSQTKEGMINQILKKFKADPRETTMITDTVGDIKIAKKIGLKTIAVTWGFQPLKLLKKIKPDYIISDLKSLDVILNKKKNFNEI